MTPQELARRTMSAFERVELVSRVLRTAYEKTETWDDEDRLGTTLAYLARAICTPGDTVQFIKVIPRDQAHLRLLREWFGPEDPVWNFITPVTDAEPSTPANTRAQSPRSV